MAAVAAVGVVATTASVFAGRRWAQRRALRTLLDGTDHAAMLRAASRVHQTALRRYHVEDDEQYLELAAASDALGAAILEVAVLHGGKTRVSRAHHQWVVTYRSSPWASTLT